MIVYYLSRVRRRARSRLRTGLSTAQLKLAILYTIRHHARAAGFVGAAESSKLVISPYRFPPFNGCVVTERSHRF